jgi:hypothetical protein
MLRRGCQPTRPATQRGREHCGWRTIRCQPARKRVILGKPSLIEACLGARTRRRETVSPARGDY